MDDKQAGAKDPGVFGATLERKPSPDLGGKVVAALWLLNSGSFHNSTSDPETCGSVNQDSGGVSWSEATTGIYPLAPFSGAGRSSSIYTS